MMVDLTKHSVHGKCQSAQDDTERESRSLETWPAIAEGEALQTTIIASSFREMRLAACSWRKKRRRKVEKEVRNMK